MKICAIANQKGGSAKTTSTRDLAAALNEKGYNVLQIDCDPQGSLTACWEYDPSELDATISDLFGLYINRTIDRVGDMIDRALIQIREGLVLLPADILLEAIDNQLVTTVSREHVLEKIISKIVEVKGAFDYILIDCRPSLSSLTINALTACNEVIIPVRAQFLDYVGFNQLYNNIELIRDETNPDIMIGGVFLTMYDGRVNMSNRVKDALNKLQELDMPICKTKISHATALADTSVKGQDIFTYYATGNAKERKKSWKSVQEYRALADELFGENNR